MVGVSRMISRVLTLRLLLARPQSGRRRQMSDGPDGSSRPLWAGAGMSGRRAGGAAKARLEGLAAGSKLVLLTGASRASNGSKGLDRIG